MTYALTVTVAGLLEGDVLVPNRYQDWVYGQSWAPVDSSGATGYTVTAINAVPGPPPYDWTAAFNRRIGGSYQVNWPVTWRVSVLREGDDPTPPDPNPEFLYFDGGPGDLETGDAYKIAGSARDVINALPLQYLLNATVQQTGMVVQDQVPATSRYNIRRANPDYVPPAPEEISGDNG